MKKVVMFLLVLVPMFLFVSFGLGANAVYAQDGEEHNFGEGKFIIKESCLFDGKLRYVCADCGEIMEQTLPAKGHSLYAVDQNMLVCYCGYSETKVTKLGKSIQTFVCTKGSMTYTCKSSDLTNGEYGFDFCEMTEALANEYRQYYPGFTKAYLFHLEYAGNACEPTADMQLSIFLDEEMKDHEMKIAVLRSGNFYYLEDVEIKKGEVLIAGEYLSGVDAVFLEKGERIMMSIAVPIVVTAVTLIAAAGAVILILSRRKSNTVK